MGEFTLIRLTNTVFSSTKDLPNTIFAIRTESSARWGAVTGPQDAFALGTAYAWDVGAGRALLLLLLHVAHRAPPLRVRGRPGL